MEVPFVDLHAQYRSMRQEIDSAIAAVIKDAAFISGPYVERFERAFAQYCGTRFAIGVSSGTDALRVALLACGVGPGDEVITVSNTFIATAEAATMIGAQVRFVDIGPAGHNLDPELLEAAVTTRTRAAIPVHLYGQPAEMDPILAVGKRHGLKIVCDAAQAHGALYRGLPIATFGDATCFSFYPGKNLGAYGDAGAIVTNDEAVACKALMLRDHGRTAKYEHLVPGLNCRMDGIQAAVLLAKLPYLDQWTRRRREHAAHYDALLAHIPGLELGQPDLVGGNRSVFHLYVVRTARRAALQEELTRVGIRTGVHYPIPLHLQPAYHSVGLRKGSLPRAERWADEVLSLPMYPELADEQVEYAAHHVRRSLVD